MAFTLPKFTERKRNCRYTGHQRSAKDIKENNGDLSRAKRITSNFTKEKDVIHKKFYDAGYPKPLSTVS